MKTIVLLANTAMYMRHLELLERHLEVLLLVCVCVCVRERERETDRERERMCVVCDRMQNFTSTKAPTKNSCNLMQNFTRSKALQNAEL